MTHTEYMRKYRAEHPEYVLRSREQTRQWRSSKRGQEKRVAWREANAEQIRITTRDRMRKLRNTTQGYIANRLRARIAQALKSKSANTRNLIGCSFEEFCRYIEQQFQKGMSWANRQLWHIDHRKPISSFNLSTLEGQQAAFHYSNCQPLWVVDNLRKGATV